MSHQRYALQSVYLVGRLVVHLVDTTGSHEIQDTSLNRHHGN